MIPIVDLEGAPSSLALGVSDASRTWGAFFVRRHGVSAALIAAHFAMARAFFALGDAEKRSIDVTNAPSFRGYEPLGTRTLDERTPGDAKEGFIMGPDLPPDHPHVLAGYPNTGANRWPLRPAGFRQHMEAYVDAMNGLGRRLAQVLARSLHAPANVFDAWFDEPLTYSQLFRYPSLASSAPAAQLGAGAHVDWGMLTILLQDDVGGLQFRAPDGAWVDAPPVPGTFAIILGEMMIRLTDGRYRSATHRVGRNTSGRSRYSMPTFFDPGYDVRIACIDACRPSTGEPRYPPCTVAEHMREMAHRTFS